MSTLFIIILITVIKMVILVVLGRMIRLVGLNVGNAKGDIIEARMERDPVGTWFYGTVVAPTLEEIVFRIIPSLAISLFTKSVCWVVGIPLAILFALAHGVEDSKGRLVIPILPFIAGCFYWYIAREYGGGWAIFSHAFSNGFFLTMYIMVSLQICRDNKHAR